MTPVWWDFPIRRGERTMSANSWWPGVVVNRSSMPVWVLWDEGEGANKQWFGKPLAAGRRSPKGHDIDGVAAYLDQMKIASLDWLGHIKTATPDWWWLETGAEGVIKDGYAIQTIKQTSQIGSLKVVKDSDVANWGVNWTAEVDLSWGVKL